MALSTRIWILAGMAVAVLVAAVLILYGDDEHSTMKSRLLVAELSIGARTIRAEIAADPQSRHQGLSDRAALSEGEGMLFVFQNDGNWGFWMKDMRFQIDMLFLDENGIVNTLYQNVSPDTYPQIFYPALASRYVLEVPGGHAMRQGVAIGTHISIPAEVLSQAQLQN